MWVILNCSNVFEKNYCSLIYIFKYITSIKHFFVYSIVGIFFFIKQYRYAVHANAQVLKENITQNFFL